MLRQTFFDLVLPAIGACNSGVHICIMLRVPKHGLSTMRSRTKTILLVIGSARIDTHIYVGREFMASGMPPNRTHSISLALNEYEPIYVRIEVH